MNTELFGVILIYCLVLALAIPLGRYIGKVFNYENNWLDKFFNPLDNLFFKLSGIDPKMEMTWQQHLVALGTINIFWFIISMLVLTNMDWLYSRPSVVGYNAAGSGGSNKGPSNPDYLAEVLARVDTFLAHNPGVSKSDIPSELMTASGSGLDPNISVQSAQVQVKRIGKIRNINESNLEQLIAQNTEKPLFGLFGTEKINVLKLNLALDSFK